MAWFVHGIRSFFPDAWDKFSGFVPTHKRHDLLGAYARRLDDPEPQVRIETARHWGTYEGSCSTLLASTSTVAHYADDRFALGLARIEAHCFANGCFLEHDQLISGIDRISHLPCSVVQGRCKMVCPIDTTNGLHHAWPEAEYLVVSDAGHSAWEPGICAQLVATMGRLKNAMSV
jgi:proline iminopeptidase